MLVEGMSMRATSRVAEVSINTVTKLMVEAGEACAAYHDETVRDVTASKVQCDEIWAFCYAKEKNVAKAKAAPRGAGDVWTWTGLDSDSKMILSWEVGDRSGATAIEFMDDPRSRLPNRVQLTTDGHKAYLEAVEGAFGGDVDFAQLVKLYGEPTGKQGHERKYSPSECVGTRKRRIEGNPDKAAISTSHVDRVIARWLWYGAEPGPRSRATYLIGVAQVAGRVAGAVRRRCRTERAWIRFEFRGEVLSRPKEWR